MQALFLLDHLAVHLDRLGRASADLDQDRRLKVAALHIMLDAIAVFARSEPSGGPLTGIDPKTRALDVLVIDDRLAVAGRNSGKCCSSNGCAYALSHSVRNSAYLY